MRAEKYCPRIGQELRSLAFWRDVLVEFVGTFFLVSVQVAVALTWGVPGHGQAVQVGLSVGFIVGCMAWSLGDFSGGHLNPAVTLGMAVLLKVTIFRAFFYMIAQTIGGIAGAAFVFGVTPKNHREALASTTPGPDVDDWQAVLIELWITAILFFTIIGSTNAKRKGNVYMPPIFIAFAIALGIMTAFGSTGGSMNPARSLGPAVVMYGWLKDEDDTYEHYVDVDRIIEKSWIYVVGPMAGAVIAAIFYLLFDLVDRRRAYDETHGQAGATGTCGKKKKVPTATLR